MGFYVLFFDLQSLSRTSFYYASRLFSGEIDRCLKKVTEGVETFEDIWQKVFGKVTSQTRSSNKHDCDAILSTLNSHLDSLDDTKFLTHSFRFTMPQTQIRKRNTKQILRKKSRNYRFGYYYCFVPIEICNINCAPHIASTFGFTASL